METAPQSSTVYRVRGLVKSYGDQRILDGLDFDIRRGESFVILGRSGSGKSVTLRQLNGLEKPDSGSIRLDGTEITTMTERQLRPLRRRVAMLFQGGALFDSMTVFDNIAFPLREHTDWDRKRIADAVRRKLDQVKLGDIEHSLPASLSGGMRKRVALARALIMDPEVVLFDEPTTGLDPMTSATIAHHIRRAQEQLEATSVVVTHDIALARHVGDRLAFLEGGRFRFLGTWEEAERAGDRLLLDFLAGREGDAHAA